MLTLQYNEFKGSGAQEKSGILIKTRGIINVLIEGNTFSNNRVKRVAILWGAKNNVESKNNLSNSGQIKTEENLVLKLMY